MSYLVLARKWRPQQFAEILGQKHVTQTLTNALNSGRVAHAFLFTGARGVGKTSAARILAKALNCEANEGPTATPCGVCTSCVEIAEGRSTDVFEIDAASNTGVANVREIIDNVRYLPNHARHKIYIIDEVHMLSTGAFNALLKTIEEPPSHVKFVLATTDVHRVPVTILSRCQRYDFRRIPVTRIGDRLSEILGAENIEHDPSALSVIARESEGSMRDAQSLLERVLTFADGSAIDAGLVRDALGVADRAVLANVLDAILGRAPGDLIELVAGVYDRGLDLKRFGDALVEFVRDLLMARLLDDPARVLDRPADEIRDLIERAKSVEAVELERLFEQLCRVVEEVANSNYPRFAMEVGLASLAEAPPRVPLDALVRKLEDLEATMAGRRPVRAAPEPTAARAAPPAPSAPKSPARSEAPRSAPRREERASGPSTPSAPEAAPAASEEPPPHGFASKPPEASVASTPVTSGQDAPPRAPTPAPRLTSASYQSFVDLVRKRRPTLSGSLAQVRPLTFEVGHVELGAETRFDENTLGASDTKRYLEELLEVHFGQKTELVVRRVEPAKVDNEPMPQTLNEQHEEEVRGRRKAKADDAKTRKAVKAVSDEFGAKVAKVRVFDEN